MQVSAAGSGGGYQPQSMGVMPCFKPDGGGGAGGPQPSAKITISDAATRALTDTGNVTGASFSISKDSSGHHYMGGVDAAGFSNPETKAPTVVSAASAQGAQIDQLVNEIAKMLRTS